MYWIWVLHLHRTDTRTQMIHFVHMKQNEFFFLVRMFVFFFREILLCVIIVSKNIDFFVLFFYFFLLLRFCFVLISNSFHRDEFAFVFHNIVKYGVRWVFCLLFRRHHRLKIYREIYINFNSPELQMCMAPSYNEKQN